MKPLEITEKIPNRKPKTLEAPLKKTEAPPQIPAEKSTPSQSPQTSKNKTPGVIS